MQFAAHLSSDDITLVTLHNVFAAPSGNVNPEGCKDPLVRQEWRQTTMEQRLDYIAAMRCLMSLPSETSDQWAETFVNSPIFDDVYGFGGNGPYIQDVSDPEEFPTKTPTEIPNRTGGGCVQQGPFANLTVPMGVGNSTKYNPHCLRRDFSPTLVASAMSDEIIRRTFFKLSGMTIYAGMHLGIGGQVGENADMYSSPGDPVFYLVHGAVDKLWNDWQRTDWPARKTAIGGPDAMFAYRFDFFGDVPYENITLQYPLSFPNFGKEMVVSDMMDIRGGPFCYEYQ
ncbi:hypothetical protein COL922a_012486 [Colletotrichum nupharicola]|nr:hypothetical protein COL922a_012486 [Colletotrichum nupharicola]